MPVPQKIAEQIDGKVGETIDGKVGGIAVNIGARVCAHAGPSEVLVSHTVTDLVAGSGISFDDAGEHRLKGLDGRWRLHRVLPDAANDVTR